MAKILYQKQFNGKDRGIYKFAYTQTDMGYILYICKLHSHDEYILLHLALQDLQYKSNSRII